MKSYLRSHKTGMLRALAASVLLMLVFGAYLVLVGIPRTTARNLYNKGEVALQAGDLATAKQNFAQAYQAWPEGYIQAALNQLP